MTLRTWIDKVLGRQTPPTEPPPPRGLDEPVIHGPEGEEEEVAAGKTEEDRPATPPDPPNP
jgi:hypothetical protein